MAAVEVGFEESLSQVVSGINLENVSFSVEQKEVIRNTIISRNTHRHALATH